MRSETVAYLGSQRQKPVSLFYNTGHAAWKQEIVLTPYLHYGWRTVGQWIHCSCIFLNLPWSLLITSSKRNACSVPSPVLCSTAKAASMDCIWGVFSHFLCLTVSKGFFFFVTALNECFLRTLLTVCRDRLRNDRIDVLGGLNSISSFASSDLCKNVVLGGSRQFTRLARRRNGSMGKKVLEYSGYCRLANTSFRQ